MSNDDLSIHKLPPQNLEAEQSVLGGILIDNEAINTVLELIIPQDFYRESHRKIFDCMIDLSEKGQPIDIITLTDELKKKNTLDEVGGIPYIAYLADSVPTAANVKVYSRIVKEKSILRRLISTTTEIATRCYEAEGDVEEFLDHAEKVIFEISEAKIRPSFFSMRDIVKDSFKTIESLYEKRELVTGVPTGFKDLDKMTSGLQRSDLIVVAGRPSMGKTAFCLNIAQYAAIEGKVPVAVFSLEMSKEQLAMRMLCSEARVDASRLRGGFLSESDWPKLTRAAGYLSEAPIFIDDTPAISLLEMRAKARRLKAQNGIGMIIVDYLQLMRGRGRGSAERREQEISEISRGLKSLAKELGVPVIALSQLNRAVENRTDRRPQLADLRESGAIEQDADVIMFIYRDEVYNKSDDNPNRGVAEIIIGKQRNGPVGTVKLTFLNRYTAFEDLAHDPDSSFSD